MSETVAVPTCTRRTAYVPGMTRDEFVAAHVKVCTCAQVKKYSWTTRHSGRLRSLEYSRKKCAKALWRRIEKKLAGVPA